MDSRNFDCQINYWDGVEESRKDANDKKGGSHHYFIPRCRPQNYINRAAISGKLETLEVKIANMCTVYIECGMGFEEAYYSEQVRISKHSERKLERNAYDPILKFITMTLVH